MVVAMGAAIYHDSASAPPAIGTNGLCGCTAVAIISQVGTIVAQVSPSFNTIDAQLEEIQRLYNEFNQPQAQAYAYYFPPTDSTGELLVEVFQDYIKPFMQNSMSLGASTMAYLANPESTDDHELTAVVRKDRWGNCLVFERRTGQLGPKAAENPITFDEIWGSMQNNTKIDHLNGKALHVR